MNPGIQPIEQTPAALRAPLTICVPELLQKLMAPDMIRAYGELQSFMIFPNGTSRALYSVGSLFFAADGSRVTKPSPEVQEVIADDKSGKLQNAK